MPLLFAQEGTKSHIVKIGGLPETKQFLENLGFVIGSSVLVVHSIGGNVIVKIKGTRVAISREMAGKIYVE